MGEFVIQFLRRTFKEEVVKAVKYYSLISVWNSLRLTEREIQLLAYTSIRGTISSLSSKEEFSRLYGSSPATINNMISKLRATGLLVKSQGKYKVNEQINLDFSKSVVLTFKLYNPEDATG